MEQETKQFTVKELAEHLGVEYIDASGFLKVLTHCSDLVPTKKLKAPGKRGKSSFLFNLPPVIEIQIWKENEEKVETVETENITEVSPVIPEESISSVS